MSDLSTRECVVCGKPLPKQGCKCQRRQTVDRDPRVSTPTGFAYDSGDMRERDAEMSEDRRDYDKMPWRKQPLHITPINPIEPPDREPTFVPVAPVTGRAKKRSKQ